MGMFSSDPRPVVDCSQDEGRTKQAFKDECDVNQIMARYEKTGLITHLAKKQPVYLDVSEVGDYRDALEHVEQTREFFMGFPAKIRAALALCFSVITYFCKCCLIPRPSGVKYAS